MDKKTLKEIYKKRAPTYDLEEKLFPLVGFSMQKYRVEAVEALNLHRGDTVVEICCGTGLNFPLILEWIGKEGKIIGVDQSSDMLRQAKATAIKQGWENVELVESDVAKYTFPNKVNAIITSFAITLVPEYDAIIKKGAKTLSTGGRFVVLDFKKPKWPVWLIKLMLHLLVKPYGGTLEMTERHPWKSIDTYLKRAAYKEYYFGSTYYIAGEKKENY